LQDTGDRAGKSPGDVIEVELENKHGALVYEIKVLTEM
jgi:uncharacterized membrane protein YkoI